MRRKTRVDTGSRVAAAAALLTATLLSSGVAAAAAGGAPERLYVSDDTGGGLVIVAAPGRSVVARIAVGKRPRGIQLSSDHQKLYVALSGSPIAGPNVDESKLPPPDRRYDGIGVVDLKLQKLINTYPSGADPEAFALSHDGKVLYVSNEDVGKLSDRKSTRLNSSHQIISYAVFCLKKKKKTQN